MAIKEMEASAGQNSLMIPLFFFCVVDLVLAWRALNWAWFQPKRLEKLLREQGFKGNPYKLLHGDYKEMKAMFKEAHSKPLHLSDDILPRIIPNVLKTVKKHGKNSYLWFGPQPSVLIMEPELIREVTRNIKVFYKGRTNPLTKLIAQGIANHEGVEWAKQRKLLNPVFHMEKLKLMIPAFYQSASQMLRKWEDIASEEGSCEVDVWPYLQALTGDVISRTAFGSNYEQGKRIFELQIEQTEHLLEALRSVYFPGLRFLPTKRNRRMKHIDKEVDNAIREIIDARMRSMVCRETNDNDLLGLLLESMYPGNDKQGNKKPGVTIEDVIQQCKLFYFAGQETTSVLLVWTMTLLSRFQDWQSRAREEVLQIFGANNPDFDGLNRLKIVDMVLYEVLRLYPPVTILNRRTVEETILGNLNLPAGVFLRIPTILMHHDPEIWGDDAKEFKPERFAEGVSHATKGQVVFFHFSWGPRICIGQNFAMLEAKLALAMILQRFSFELSPSYSHAPRQVMTLQPQTGAHLIIHKL